MKPIVDRLTAEYSDRVTFRAMNAQDGGEGQSLFASIRLPGHPGYVLYNNNQIETYRGFGIVAEADLRQAIETALIAE